MENTTYIIQFHNCGAVYTCQGKLVVDYQGHKPPNEIKNWRKLRKVNIVSSDFSDGSISPPHLGLFQMIYRQHLKT